MFVSVERGIDSNQGNVLGFFQVVQFSFLKGRVFCLILKQCLILSGDFGFVLLGLIFFCCVIDRLYDVFDVVDINKRYYL